jgi:hypothetical protein
MAGLEAGSVDMVLCDLPYGTTARSWDTVIPFEPLWEQYRRIVKPNAAIVLFGSQPFTSALIMSNLREFRYCWYWVKSRPVGFLNANKMPLRSVEDVCVFYCTSPTFNPQGLTPVNRRMTNSTSKQTRSGAGIAAHNGGRLTGDFISEVYT